MQYFLKLQGVSEPAIVYQYEPLEQVLIAYLPNQYEPLEQVLQKAAPTKVSTI
jgi:hypothetical protein